MSDNLQKYVNQMSLINMRISVIDNIISKRTTTGYRYSDIEICILEIRKIIELIAMGSLISNKDEYSKIHEKYSSEWNAKLIFKDIERINASFYPEPINIDKSCEFDNFVPMTDGYMTRDDAIKIYEKCGAFLHEDNPYSSPHDVKYYEKMIPIWKRMIVSLLKRHLVHIYEDEMYLVVMQSEENGNPKGYVFEKVKNDL